MRKGKFFKMWTSSFVSKVVFEVSKNSGEVFLYNSVALTQWQFDFHDKNELLLPILRYSFFFSVTHTTGPTEFLQ